MRLPRGAGIIGCDACMNRWAAPGGPLLLLSLLLLLPLAPLQQVLLVQMLHWVLAQLRCPCA